ncbi:MAG: hypothetical protein HY876_09645 [Coriobacteriales bacterium]|nr:hypothetical protein [Coriobacteriales bacterium]
MFLGLILAAAVIVFAITALGASPVPSLAHVSPIDGAIHLLRGRLARGEITIDEFERIADVLRS